MTADPLHVLIVEDEPSHVELIRFPLDQSGKFDRISFARTLTEGRRYVEEHRPDVVIADLHLHDGLGTALIDNHEEPLYPVVILTSERDAHVITDAMRAGAMDYAVKSANTFHELPRIVMRAYAQWQVLVSGKKKAERRNEELLKIDKMESLGALVSGVAHEINNPINYILLNTTILTDAWESVVPILDEYCETNGDFDVGGIAYSEMRDDVRKLFTGVKEGAHRINGIVQDLKEYARSLPPDLNESVDINRLVKSAASLMRGKVADAKCELNAQYAPGTLQVRGSFQRLLQVIINLLQNACEASEPGSTIRLTTEDVDSGEGVRIEIADDGEGMTKEQALKASDPFCTTKRNTGATGLGLSVAMGIVEQHMGRMQFDTSPGEGTVVRITLPAAEGA